MGLLAGQLQEVQLHVDEGIETTLRQVSQSDGGGITGNALLNSGGDDLVFPLRQVEKQLLAFDEI